MDRRKFLSALAVAGFGATVTAKGAMHVLSQNLVSQNGNQADLVAVMGGDGDEMFRRGITEMGGMSKFVKPGYKVCVKPNIGWDKTPELAANANPKVVGEIVKQCFDAGASEVLVFDNTCDDWKQCYQNSGIEKAAKDAGANMVPGHQESYYRNVAIPRGKKLKEAKIHEAILDSDVWINVPVLKHHGGARLSISMKNHMGIVWDRRFFHRNDLQQCIADICTLENKPVLNVVDAYRTLKSNGPRGKSDADVVLTKSLFMSQDIVAVDTAAAKFFSQIEDMPIDHVEHLANGQDLNIGTMNLESLNIKRIKL